jgi:hypothetical protein
MKINDFAGKSVEDQLIRLKRVQKSLDHRLNHYRSIFGDLENQISQTNPIHVKKNPNDIEYLSLKSPYGRGGVIYITNTPQHQRLAIELNNISRAGDRLEKEIDKNRKAQRSAMKQSVIADPQAAAIQIPAFQVPKVVRLSGRDTVDNPYYFSTINRYAGSPEGFNWDAIAAVEFYNLKQLMAKYGLHFDVVYASEGSRGNPAFLAVGGHGDIIYTRKPSHDRTTRLFLLGTQHKTSRALQPSRIINALKKIQLIHQPSAVQV